MRPLTAVVYALALTALVGPEIAQADAPTLVPFQGYLTDDAGAPLSGEHQLAMSLYDVATGGTALFTETQMVMVDQGFFTVYLGDVAALDLALFRDHGTVYLGLNVDDDGEMAPRLSMGSVPYAGFAQYCGDAASVGGLSGTALQSRVTGMCTAGQAIRVIAADGTVTCEPVGGSGSYSAGFGLSLTGTTFAVDSAVVQSRVSGTCMAGSSIRAIARDGTVTCETDDGATYSAGAGLTLTGTTFSADTSVVQSRVTGMCAAGSSIRVIAVDGTVTCEPDDTGGGGSGWLLTGNAGTAATDFIGTTDAQSVNIRVNGSRALLLENATIPNVIGGSSANNVTAGAFAAAIGGGGSGLGRNRVSDNYGTVGGGASNRAGDLAGTTSDRPYATVGGGLANQASGTHSTVAGGQGNTASGDHGFAGGGQGNEAGGPYSTVGGGQGNTAGLPTGFLASYVTIAGGRSNVTFDNYTTIGGGQGNAAGYDGAGLGDHATVAGGLNNTAAGPACVVGGGEGNSAGTVGIDHATVGGGSSNTASGRVSTVSGGTTNTATALRSTVSGGWNNNATANSATVGGGENNNASGSVATVAGGQNNSASGSLATVPGGYRNIASGNYSFAAGRQAIAANAGCFVWGDSTAANVNCPANNRWVARASGGVYFYTNAAMSTGVRVAAGGGSWASLSDRNVKHDVEPVDPTQVLERVADMPISTWRYDSEESGAQHMGPMAQDFHAAFGLGDSDRSITAVDADGVALAAIQGLNEKVEADNAALRARVSELETRLVTLEHASGTGQPGWLAASGLGLGVIALAFLRRRRG